jgi:hypothetical protein
MHNSPIQNVVLLTATVTPPQGAAQLARTDPRVRLADYANALEFYLKHLKKGSISGLIFSDNSNSNIDVLHDMVEKYDVTNQVEFISYPGLDYSPSFGRGYGEFKMVDYVMEHSKLISQLPGSANIWKITGRYILKNLTEVIKSKPQNIDFYCNCRNIPKYWIDLYVLCWNKSAYELIIKNICEDIKEGSIPGSAEIAFRRVLDQTKFDVSIAKRFKTIPLLQGHRGVDNKSYADMGLKLILRKSALRIAPWLWI